MAKVILILLFTCTCYGQFHRLNDRTEGFRLLYNPYGSSVYTPTFAGFDTTKFHPYSQTYLYFNGFQRGAFVRHLGSNAVQYMLGLVSSTTDSFDISWEMNSNITGRSVMGKLSGGTGWTIGIGTALGASFVECYFQGISTFAIDTIASDTAKHLYRVKYNKNSTTIQAWRDGVRTVNNTSATTSIGAHSLSFTLGYAGSNNNISDTTQAPSGSGFRGGIYSFSLTRWSGGTDTTYTLVFTGAGENLYALVTSGGNYVNGLIDFDRADYTDVLASPHLELGQSPGRDIRNPVWVNTGSLPAFIDTCAGGVSFFRSSTSVSNTDEYVESYTNSEGLYIKGIDTFVVVGGQINTYGVTNYRAIGTASSFIARYNYRTKTWSAFNETQAPNNNIISVCQWGTDTLIAGGSQTAFTGIARTNGIGRFDGTSWSSIDSGFNGQVVYVTNIDDTLYAGGSYTQSGNTTINRMAKITKGGQWQGFGTGMGGEVYAIIKYKNEIYAGGSFVTANDVTCNGFAKWNGTTFVPYGTGLKTSAGGTGYIFCFAIYNNELYMGGSFDSVSGIKCSNLAKFDGTTFTAVGTSITRGTQGGAVIDLQVDNTYNQLWVVGQFSKLNGKTAYCGAIYNGVTFTALPFQDMRPEGIVITNNSTAGIKYFIAGDQMSVYGVNVQNIFEIIPTWQR